VTITLAHGAGGRLSHQLVQEHFLPRLSNAVLGELTDAAVIGDLALTTDGYVVTPRFFPGGDLGRLAVCGTVNDLAMVGAEPLALTAGFILEEGLPLEELDRIVDSMAAASRETGVPVVAGDTKVVARGACDGIFITTSGVGRLTPELRPAPSKARPGDVVILSGTMADHGMAVMASREGLRLEGDLRSDVAPVLGLVRALRRAGVEVHALRDPTRGGVAQSLLEIAGAARIGIVLQQRALPIRPPVAAACELFGIDPLYVANEGKLLCFVPEADADRALAALRAEPLGASAVAIGVAEPGEGTVAIATTLGARRLVRMPLPGGGRRNSAAGHRLNPLGGGALLGVGPRAPAALEQRHHEAEAQHEQHGIPRVGRAIEPTARVRVGAWRSQGMVRPGSDIRLVRSERAPARSLAVGPPPRSGTAVRRWSVRQRWSEASRRPRLPPCRATARSWRRTVATARRLPPSQPARRRSPPRARCLRPGPAS
jgi:hydrogenase expression/formation protein HypE